MTAKERASENFGMLLGALILPAIIVGVIWVLVIASRGTPVTSDDLSVVNSYYAKRAIGGGWVVGSFKARDSEAVADLYMDNAQACAFREDSLEQRQTAFSIACPYSNDYIWSKIKPDQDIVLEVSCDGSRYHEQSCRSHRRSGALLP